nr:YihY/virulence factor BrkB family protein [uncultured Noviherbaspirillum sp.]
MTETPPRRVGFKDLFDMARAAVSAWSSDYAPSMGAALSYYTVFSIAPLLLIVISIAGLVYGEDAARGAVFYQVRGMMGDSAAVALQGLLASVDKPGQSIVAATVGVLLLIVGATSVFGELQSALDRIWRTPDQAKKGGLWQLVRTRLVSFAMIVGIGILLIASLFASAALAFLENWWGTLFGAQALVASALNILLSYLIVTVMFAMIYKIMPRVRIAWRDVWTGAAITGILFTVGKYLIGLYIGRSGVTSTFGAAGSLVVILLWVYYSAQIFLLGAEFTWVYAHRFGSRRPH